MNSAGYIYAVGQDSEFHPRVSLKRDILLNVTSSNRAGFYGTRAPSTTAG